jgi:hypothetical protein
MSRALLLLLLAHDRRRPRAREALVERISGEFHEMPCLRLTLAQAQRLFGVRSDVCQRVLSALVADRTLTRDIDQRYRLNDCSGWPVGRMARTAREAHLIR